MGRTASQVSREKILSAVESLGGCLKSVAEMRIYMEANEMPHIWIIWSKETDKLLRKIRVLSKDAADALEEEKSARLEKRPNHYDAEKTRSIRDAAVKKEKKNSAGISPAKRGRPPKKKGA